MLFSMVGAFKTWIVYLTFFLSFFLSGLLHSKVWDRKKWWCLKQATTSSLQHHIPCSFSLVLVVWNLFILLSLFSFFFVTSSKIYFRFGYKSTFKDVLTLTQCVPASNTFNWEGKILTITYNLAYCLKKFYLLRSK